MNNQILDLFKSSSWPHRVVNRILGRVSIGYFRRENAQRPRFQPRNAPSMGLIWCIYGGLRGSLPRCLWVSGGVFKHMLNICSIICFNIWQQVAASCRQLTANCHASRVRLHCHRIATALPSHCDRIAIALRPHCHRIATALPTWVIVWLSVGFHLGFVRAPVRLGGSKG